MRRVSRYLISIICFSMAIMLSGCSLKKDNGAFDFMENSNIMKVTIQSTRDISYKFTVTDKEVIGDIYKILSKAKKVETKSTLEPDYVFEIYEGPEKAHKFNYVAGLDKSDGANFYDENNNYIVSKRLDNDIIKNFWNIRKPIDFDKVYYNSIIAVTAKYLEELDKDVKIGVDIDKDIEMAKFILSTDLIRFEKNLSKVNGTTIIKEDKQEGYDIIMSLKTEGYTSTKYKGIATFQGKAGDKETTYYIMNNYDNGEWHINITKEQPEGF
ncbi:MAG: hypothetical protein ACRCW0_04150 [Clostridium sp.]